MVQQKNKYSELFKLKYKSYDIIYQFNVSLSLALLLCPDGFVLCEIQQHLQGTHNP